MIKMLIAGLALLFIALKLTGHIFWSWWLVLAPLWVLPAAGAVVIAIILFRVIRITR